MEPHRTRGIISLGIVIALMSSTWLIAGLGAGAAGRPRSLGTTPPPPTPMDDDNDGIENGDEREIAFVSARDGNKEIYVMNDDGSFVRRLTSNAARDVTPVWSPNRQMIAFASRRDGDFEIYVMDALDGIPVTKLTNNAGKQDVQPAWSNNPHLIAFSSDRDGDYEIYEMDSDDGGNVMQVTSNNAKDFSPTYSFDGAAAARGTLTTSTCTRLAFASNRTGNWDIFITDGETATNLSNHPGKDIEPDWALMQFSSQFQMIFWASNRDGDLDIWGAMPPDCSSAERRTLGGGPTIEQVTFAPRAQVQPSAHFDRAVYAGNQSGNYEIYRGPDRLTTNGALDVNPDQSHFPIPE
jgi:Tol biopolymer transport system component